MSDPTPERRTLWTPKTQTAAAIVAIIVIAGIILAILNLTQRPPTNPPTHPAPTSTTARPETGCPQLGTDVGTGTLTEAPDTSWTLVGRMAAPTVPDAGPALADHDGWRHCYARTPTGALVATANLIAMSSVPELRARLASDGLMPSEARDRLMASPEPATGSTNAMQIRGFRLVSFTSETAVIDLAVETQGRYAAMMITLHWHEGDWRLGVRGQGPNEELDIDYSWPPNLYGFISWAGA